MRLLRRGPRRAGAARVPAEPPHRPRHVHRARRAGVRAPGVPRGRGRRAGRGLPPWRLPLPRREPPRRRAPRGARPRARAGRHRARALPDRLGERHRGRALRGDGTRHDRGTPRPRAARLPRACARRGPAHPPRRARRPRRAARPGQAARRLLLERLLRRLRGGGDRSRRGARPLARAPRGGALADRARSQARRRGGLAGRRDRRRVRERGGAAHRAGRVGAAAAQEGARRRLVRRLRAHGRGGRAREHVVAGGDPRRRLPQAGLGLEPGRAAPRRPHPGRRPRALAARAALARAAARRRRSGGLHRPRLPALASDRRGGARRAARRRPAADRRGARAERGALRHLPAQGLAPGAARGDLAPPHRDLGARSGTLLPRAGARLPRSRYAAGVPARLRRGGHAVPRLLRPARRRARSGRGDAVGVRVAPRGRRGGATRARGGAAGSGGHVLALLLRGGARAGARSPAEEGER